MRTHTWADLLCVHQNYIYFCLLVHPVTQSHLIGREVDTSLPKNTHIQRIRRYQALYKREKKELCHDPCIVCIENMSEGTCVGLTLGILCALFFGISGSGILSSSDLSSS